MCVRRENAEHILESMMQDEINEFHLVGVVATHPELFLYTIVRQTDEKLLAQAIRHYVHVHLSQGCSGYLILQRR